MTKAESDRAKFFALSPEDKKKAVAYFKKLDEAKANRSKPQTEPAPSDNPSRGPSRAPEPAPSGDPAPPAPPTSSSTAPSTPPTAPGPDPTPAPSKTTPPFSTAPFQGVTGPGWYTWTSPDNKYHPAAAHAPGAKYYVKSGNTYKVGTPPDTSAPNTSRRQPKKQGWDSITTYGGGLNIYKDGKQFGHFWSTDAKAPSITNQEYARDFKYHSSKDGGYTIAFPDGTDFVGYDKNGKRVK